MTGRIVIVGASLAGVRVAESLRGNGFDGELVIIGDEPYAPYDRPPLSKTVLSGWLGTHQLDLPCARDARWLLGVAATGLDLGQRVVRLADGRAIEFDQLVIATGTRARPWPIPEQAALRGVHVLRGRDDADRLRADLAAGPERVLVIGGGFTGSEVASSCHDLGLPVTVTHRGVAPLASALGAEIGGVIGDRQRSRGIDLRVGTTVVELAGDDRLRRARLSDGDELAVGVAVVAAGSLRNTEWLAGSGLAADCDSAGRALDAHGGVVEGVFVAGDVARWEHPLFRAGPMSLEHWGNAIDQADTAAHNLLHPDDLRHTTALPAFWSDQFGLNIKSVGLPHLADAMVLTQGSVQRGPFVAAYGRDGVTIGAVAVNSPRVLDGYAALITERASFPPEINATDAA